MKTRGGFVKRKQSIFKDDRRKKRQKWAGKVEDKDKQEENKRQRKEETQKHTKKNSASATHAQCRNLGIPF
jgi:hypothetical protein